MTVEGPDGAGKSTLCAALSERFRADGLEVLLTREPGDGPVGPAIREILLTGETIDSWTEVFLFLADRRQHVERIIRPALDRGACVLCDRYVDSTIVYQGYGRDLPVEQLRKLNHLATAGLMPQATLLLDLPADEGLARVAEKNRLDNEPLQFHMRIREGFLAEARRDPGRFVVLDARESPESVAEKAYSELKVKGPVGHN